MNSMIWYRATNGPNNLTVAVDPLIALEPDTTPLGTKIASLRGSWSSGRPFTGIYIFASPNFNNGLTTDPSGGTTGVFAITINPDGTGNLIVNPNGPGLTAGTENYTVEAST